MKLARLVVVKTDQYDIKQYTPLSAWANTDPLTVDIRDVDLKPSGADAYMVQSELILLLEVDRWGFANGVYK